VRCTQVNFHLTQLECNGTDGARGFAACTTCASQHGTSARRPPPRRQTPQQARAKNRRLAHMVELERQGYFSEETMRRR
jgi:hypothetical protein